MGSITVFGMEDQPSRFQLHQAREQCGDVLARDVESDGENGEPISEHRLRVADAGEYEAMEWPKVGFGAWAGAW